MSFQYLPRVFSTTIRRTIFFRARGTIFFRVISNGSNLPRGYVSCERSSELIANHIFRESLAALLHNRERERRESEKKSGFGPAAREEDSRGRVGGWFRRWFKSDACVSRVRGCPG